MVRHEDVHQAVKEVSRRLWTSEEIDIVEYPVGRDRFNFGKRLIR